MPSPNSSANNLTVRFSAPELVTDALVDAVFSNWTEYVAKEMDCDWRMISADRDWHYYEAMEYLIGSVLELLGVQRPNSCAPLLIDVSPDHKEAECEVVMVWTHSAHLDPGEISEDCTVARMIDMPLAFKGRFFNDSQVRRNIIARWVYALSQIADGLPEKET